MSRVMVAPGRWRDDGPQAAHSKTNHYAVSGVTGAAMVPIMAPIPQTANEQRHAAAKPRKEPERCGRYMPVLKTSCYRRKGHKHSCHSEAYLVKWNDYRNRQVGR